VFDNIFLSLLRSLPEEGIRSQCSPKTATNVIAKPEVNSKCGIIVAARICSKLPPTITAVITYANREIARYFNILAYILYGISISERTMNAVNDSVATTKRHLRDQKSD
jgi:hypothetical protein